MLPKWRKEYQVKDVYFVEHNQSVLHSKFVKCLSPKTNPD